MPGILSALRLLLFYPYNKPVRQTELLRPFYGWETKALPKLT